MPNPMCEESVAKEVEYQRKLRGEGAVDFKGAMPKTLVSERLRSVQKFNVSKPIRQVKGNRELVK